MRALLTDASGSSFSPWPTPSAGLHNDAEAPESWMARAEVLKAKHGNGNGAGTPLAVAAKLSASAWPTPTANDHKGSSAPGQRRGQLDEAAENIPAWTPCECCGELLCTIHRTHTHDCGCPPVEEWTVDPYARTGQRLNPAWVESLMGFPSGWTVTDGPQAAAKRSTNGKPLASRKASRNGGTG